MKKILFCLQTMVMGGVEKELITVFKRFNTNGYDIELLLFYIQDEKIIKNIPKYVKVTVLNIDKEYWFSNVKGYIASRFKKMHILEAGKIAVRSLLGGGASSAYINLNELETLPNEYDTAICYHIHSAVMLRYVAEKILAKRKIAWIHNDFNASGFRVERYYKALTEYDKIVAVSERLRLEFMEHCPKLAKKTLTIHNVVDVEEIRLKAKEPTDDFFSNDNRKKIITVGRYVEQKGYDIAISACKHLVENGMDIAWYAIGWGPEEEHLRELVEKNHLENNFYVLGRKDNPYPYIAEADLYVQPSRHEGYAITICEAMALNKFIVSTNFSGAKEQIQDEKSGLIIQTFEPTDLAKVIMGVVNKQHVVNNDIKDDWGKIVEIVSGV